MGFQIHHPTLALWFLEEEVGHRRRGSQRGQEPHYEPGQHQAPQFRTLVKETPT